jgi:hypothetical protein
MLELRIPRRADVLCASSAITSSLTSQLRALPAIVVGLPWDQCFGTVQQTRCLYIRDHGVAGHGGIKREYQGVEDDDGGIFRYAELEVLCA